MRSPGKNFRLALIESFGFITQKRLGSVQLRWDDELKHMGRIIRKSLFKELAPIESIHKQFDRIPQRLDAAGETA